MAARRLELYRFGGMTLDLARGSLRNGSGDVRLRPKSFDLLTYFVSNAGRLLSKDELLEAVWPGVFVTEDSLVQRVKEIRRAVGDGEQVLIKTIPGRGYIFDLPVTVVELAETAPAGSAHLPGWRRRISVFDWRIATGAALVLLSIGLGWWLFAPSLQRALPAAATAPPPRSIMVLPFANLSGDPAQDYLADVITEELTTSLSRRLTLIKVVARSTAFAYKGKPVDAKQIGRELGVGYMLEGSVQRSATHVRVNAQLIDAPTGSHLWAEAFDREGSDFFAVHDEIASRIANTVWFQLFDIEAKRSERRGTSQDVTDYLIRGVAAWHRGYFNKDTYRAVAELYGKAVQLDGHDPRALTGLADALTSAAGDGFSDTPQDDLRRADELVSDALAIDPNYWYAHHIRGNILRYEKHYDEAMAEYETVLALNPPFVISRSHLAWIKIVVGEPAEAIPLLEQAMRISPFDENIGLIQYRLGLANLLLGNTDEAIRWSEKAVLTFSYSPSSAYRNLAAAFALKGDKTAAQVALAEAIKRKPEWTTIAKVRGQLLDLSDRPKFVALLDRTVIEGLRQAGLPE
jgi:TolB-like protein/DNA-binding winged helix-turn-helix (wHTH) protein/Flp pilus assembly protein TadD